MLVVCLWPAEVPMPHSEVEQELEVHWRPGRPLENCSAVAQRVSAQAPVALAPCSDYDGGVVVPGFEAYGNDDALRVSGFCYGDVDRSGARGMVASHLHR